MFPNTLGHVEERANIVKGGLYPAQITAGIIVPVLDDNGAHKADEEGKPVIAAKYPGLHALRHFYASWCFNRKADGGLELPPKVVQERLGHSTIAMTMDTYWHLFPRRDDGTALAEAERLLLA